MISLFPLLAGHAYPRALPAPAPAVQAAPPEENPAAGADAPVIEELPDDTDEENTTSTESPDEDTDNPDASSTSDAESSKNPDGAPAAAIPAPPLPAGPTVAPAAPAITQPPGASPVMLPAVAPAIPGMIFCGYHLVCVDRTTNRCEWKPTFRPGPGFGLRRPT